MTTTDTYTRPQGELRCEDVAPTWHLYRYDADGAEEGPIEQSASTPEQPDDDETANEVTVSDPREPGVEYLWVRVTHKQAVAIITNSYTDCDALDAAQCSEDSDAVIALAQVLVETEDDDSPPARA